MTFLILTHTFHPDLEFEAQYVSAVAAELVKRGHSVSMLSGQGRITTALVRFGLQLATPPSVDVVAALSSSPSVSRLGILFARAAGAHFRSRVVAAEVETVVMDLEAAADQPAGTTEASPEPEDSSAIGTVAPSAIAAQPLRGTFGNGALAGSARPLVRGLAGRASQLSTAPRTVALPAAAAADAVPVRRSQAS